MAEMIGQGSPWPGPLKKAATVKKILDAAEHHAARVAGGQATAPDAAFQSTGRIKLKNTSGAARRKGEILQVGDYRLTTIDRGKLWFAGNLHDGKDSPFAVLLEPIPDGEIGLAQIIGVCPALVTIGLSGQRFARPTESASDLLAGEAGLGPVRILHVESAGTGEKQCLVDLSGGRFSAWGIFDEDAAIGETKTVSVHDSAGDTGLTVEAICKTAFDTGDVCSLVLMNNRIYAGCWVPVA